MTEVIKNTGNLKVDSPCFAALRGSAKNCNSWIRRHGSCRTRSAKTACLKLKLELSRDRIAIDVYNYQRIANGDNLDIRLTGSDHIGKYNCDLFQRINHGRNCQRRRGIDNIVAFANDHFIVGCSINSQSPRISGNWCTI